MDSLSRRVLVAGLVAAGLFALTHLGTPDPGEPAPIQSPSPTQTATAVATGADGRAQAALLKALDAQRVYYVDNVRFAAGAGDELTDLRSADATIAWGVEVVVVIPAAAGENSLVTVLRAPSSSGRAFCVAEVATEADAGTWYAARPAGVPCPAPRRGMPGWLGDPAGWA